MRFFKTSRLKVYLRASWTSLAATPPSLSVPIPSQPFLILDIVKWKFTALRYRARFRHVGRMSFLETRAINIAFEAGLKNRRSKRVWVGATARAEAEGQSVRDGEDDAYYRSVPWSSLSLSLRHSLSDLPTTGGDETQSVDDDNRELVEGSGRSFSGEHRFSNRAGWGARGQGKGHGSIRSFKPRRLDDHHLRFIRYLLRSFRSREAVQGEHELNQPKGDVEDTICLKTFKRFCRRWWEPVMTTLSRIPEEWESDNPVKVHGFIDRLEAERKLLKTNQPGMFLLRFSESRPGDLILTFTYEVRIFCFSASENALRKQLVRSDFFFKNCSSIIEWSTKRQMWKLVSGRASPFIWLS